MLPFGAVLRLAIREEFGTGKEFAAKVGISEGRVSQLLSGAESLTAQTLDDILRVFTSLPHRERLHAAWVRTFAPTPLDQISDRECASAAIDLLAAQGALMQEGRARELQRALLALSKREQDLERRFWLLRASAEVALYLGRSQQALASAQALTDAAQVAGEPEWIGRGLWLLATATRNTEAASTKQIAESHERAAEFVAAWSPKGGDARVLAQQMRSALLRDRALTILTLHERRPVEEAQLSQAATHLDRTLQQEMGEDTKALYLEVKGRVHLALKDTLTAEDTLAEVQSVRGYVSWDHATKTSILEGEWLVARWQPEQALAVFRDALDASYAADDLHHARVLERHLFKLGASHSG